jgi:PmbA protein
MEISQLADRSASILSEGKIDAEIYLERSLTTSAGVSSGKVESLEMQEELGAGIRVFTGGRFGFAYTSDLSPEGIKSAADLARSLAAHTDADAANKLPGHNPPPDPGQPSGEVGVARVETYRKVALARAMEEAARAVDPRITKVGEARYSDVVGELAIRNTKGFACSGSYARIYGMIDVVAESGKESQSGFASGFSFKFGDLDPFKIGREAAAKALAKLGGAKATSTRANVVLDPEVTASFLEPLAEALAADSVIKNKSFLAGQVGRQVASETVTLVDDGLFPGADRTFHFDGEGAATRRTLLIEKGLLKGYMHDSYTAAKMGLQTTGNGLRSGYMGPPRVAPTTLYLIPSAAGREEILSQVEEGFLISEVMGLHTIDPISGEFSLGASGHAIRGGRIAEPVSGMGLAGTVLDLLKGIAVVGADLRLASGGTVGSSILVKNLSISGN